MTSGPIADRRHGIRLSGMHGLWLPEYSWCTSVPLRVFCAPLCPLSRRNAPQLCSMLGKLSGNSREAVSKVCDTRSGKVERRGPCVRSRRSSLGQVTGVGGVDALDAVAAINMPRQCHARRSMAALSVSLLDPTISVFSKQSLHLQHRRCHRSATAYHPCLACDPPSIGTDKESV